MSVETLRRAAAPMRERAARFDPSRSPWFASQHGDAAALAVARAYLGESGAS